MTTYSSYPSSVLQSSYFSKEVHIMIIILYVIVTLVNFFANTMIWIAVKQNRRLRSPMNYLLLNLSLADIVSGISVYPYLFILDVGMVFKKPVKQARLCIVTEGLNIFFVASGASLLTLCGISFNRFLAISYPTRKNLRMGRKAVFRFSILTWIISTACMLPAMLSIKYQQKFKACFQEWEQIDGLVYWLCILLIGTVLPSSFLVTTYIAIVLRARVAIDTANEITVSQRNMHKAKNILGVLILIYILCWLPFSTYFILLGTTSYFPRTVDGVRSSHRWMRTTVLFCTLNGTLNPVVYITGGNQLKEAIKCILTSFWWRMCRKTVAVEAVSQTQMSTVSSSFPSKKAATERSETEANQRL